MLIRKEKKRKILIFDDDLMTLEVISIIFSEKGYDVSVSETTYNLLEIVDEIKPDLIIMDNWIPDRGGVEATLLLKNSKKYSAIPVLFISANIDIEKLAGYSYANDYIQKPFDLDHFEQKVMFLLNI
ncbi:response regulator [Chryseobacterium endophyticum]|uniref:Response regulator n=1 Tax=Chryseobacterium endophyticum TaxID=1854762 RepID=A0AAU6WL89_9FLAO|nr:response regulator [uncultured Chryseobacterium sp.]